MYPQIVTALLFVPVLCGCEGSSAEDAAPMRSATYYTQHLQEAQQVASRCRAMDEQKLHQLNSADYQEWQFSNEGINCQTAISVTEAASVRELVLKQSKPVQAAPKVVPPPSSSVPAPAMRTRNEPRYNPALTLAPV
ncbi:hypothetical protein [Duganella callida]|uniref:Uncharacterized protein n=1 Tax=Duganella callida TaxID=2561932 RepID=A0A4Y9SR01_9BURK|nr:hypothetical protein [Duganella callida]TFW27063.1 hypothetical protein E4L98_07565 [Duganella callida]